MSLGTIIGRCGASGVVHTGVGNCPKNEGHTVALILTDKNAYYPLEDFSEKLTEYIGATNNLRMMPIKKIIQNEASGGEFETNSIGFGGDMPTGISAYSEIYRIDSGDCLYKQLAKLNKRDMRVFRVDDQGYVYGTIVKRGDKELFAGFESKMFARLTKGTDKTEVGGIFLGAWYLASYEDELKNANAVDVGLVSIPDGLVGVTLQKGASGVKVVAECSGEDYTSSIEWTEEAFVNEAGTAPTSVSYAEATGELTIAPAGKYKIASASKLQASDIFGLEGVNQLVTI